MNVLSTWEALRADLTADAQEGQEAQNGLYLPLT
jgi:hypothetical protein